VAALDTLRGSCHPSCCQGGARGNRGVINCPRRWLGHRPVLKVEKQKSGDKQAPPPDTQDDSPLPQIAGERGDAQCGPSSRR